MPLLPVLISAAMAQDPASDATLLYPAIDGDRTLFTEDTTIGRPGTSQARALGTFAVDPFEAEGDGEDAAVVYLVGGLTIGPVRAGAVVPVVQTMGIGDQVSRTGVGDVLTDAKIPLVRPSRTGGFGLAVEGSATLPSATVGEYGRDGVGWKAGGVGEIHGSEWALAVDAGVAGGPEYAVGDDLVDEELYGTFAVSLAPPETRVGIAAEIVARTDLDEPFEQAATSPAEAIVTGWYRLDEDWTLRGGLGAGLNDGVGASDGRVVVGISYAPRHDADRTIEVARR